MCLVSRANSVWQSTPASAQRFLSGEVRELKFSENCSTFLKNLGKGRGTLRSTHFWVACVGSLDVALARARVQRKLGHTITHQKNHCYHGLVIDNHTGHRKKDTNAQSCYSAHLCDACLPRKQAVIV